MLIETDSGEYGLRKYLNPDHIISISIHSTSRSCFHVNIHLTKGDPDHTAFSSFAEAQNYVDSIVKQCNVKLLAEADQ